MLTYPIVKTIQHQSDHNNQKKQKNLVIHPRSMPNSLTMHIEQCNDQRPSPKDIKDNIEIVDNSIGVSAGGLMDHKLILKYFIRILADVGQM